MFRSTILASRVRATVVALFLPFVLADCSSSDGPVLVADTRVGGDTPGAGAGGACDPAGGPPGEPPPLATERVLSQLAVDKPVDLVVPPDGSGRVFVVSQPGRIHVADGFGEGAATAVWLDIRERVEDGPGEAGLLSLAFHPDFATNGELFVDYTRTQDGQLQSVVSRFRVANPPLGAPDAGSEEVLLVVDQPYGNHNGGQIAFGPDGYLYIGFGDGGSGGDPDGNGQNLGTLLGAILRVDIDTGVGGRGPGGEPYAVPADNPFVDTPEARPEIWAYGLRNPWRFSFDSESGELWAGDVGQNAVEEIDIVRRGGNYGWNRMEGSRCFQPPSGCDPTAWEAPVGEYDHSEGRSVTGGFVYRGGALPSLEGVYVFGDFASGVVWGLVPQQDGTWARVTLAETDLRIAAFGRDAAGELYVLDHGGSVHRLVAADVAAGVAGWRERLSETGCFADLTTRRLVDGMVPYEVNAPLWSDGAGKERAFGLPEGARLGFREDGAWTVPDGGVLVKTFVRDGQPVETRFIVRAGGAFRYATYRWNDGGDDGTLLRAGETATVAGQRWTFPSREDCRACHTAAAGSVLGLRTAQLNRPTASSDAPASDGSAGRNQLAAYDDAGLLEPPLPAAPDTLPRFPAPDDADAPVSERALAYLDVNCAHCHRPGGMSAASFDIRWTTDAGAGASGANDWCDASPGQGDLGVAGAAIVAPGAPERSVLWLRMVTSDPEVRMPTVGVSVVDAEGAALVEQWIRELSDCP